MLAHEFAHNLLHGVKEEYVHRMKGIMKEFISKNCLGIKKTMDKGLSINLHIYMLD